MAAFRDIAGASHVTDTPALSVFCSGNRSGTVPLSRLQQTIHPDKRGEPVDVWLRRQEDAMFKEGREKLRKEIEKQNALTERKVVQRQRKAFKTGTEAF